MGFSNIWVFTKGQLISKRFFGVINFLQKTNEWIQLYYYDTLGRLVFVRFFGRNQRHQKNISKLNDLYQSICNARGKELFFFLFFVHKLSISPHGAMCYSFWKNTGILSLLLYNSIGWEKIRSNLLSVIWNQTWNRELRKILYRF